MSDHRQPQSVSATEAPPEHPETERTHLPLTLVRGALPWLTSSPHLTSRPSSPPPRTST
jgi:hypothetical protein